MNEIESKVTYRKLLQIVVLVRVTIPNTLGGRRPNTALTLIQDRSR